MTGAKTATGGDRASVPGDGHVRMRLDLLEGGRGLGWLQKLRVWPMKALAGQVPPPVAVMSYRRELLGKRFARFLQRAMRGSAHWSKSELELFGSFTANELHCPF